MEWVIDSWEEQEPRVEVTLRAVSNEYIPKKHVLEIESTIKNSATQAYSTVVKALLYLNVVYKGVEGRLDCLAKITRISRVKYRVSMSKELIVRYGGREVKVRGFKGVDDLFNMLVKELGTPDGGVVELVNHIMRKKYLDEVIIDKDVVVKFGDNEVVLDRGRCKILPRLIDNVGKVVVRGLREGDENIVADLIIKSKFWGSPVMDLLRLYRGGDEEVKKVVLKIMGRHYFLGKISSLLNQLSGKEVIGVLKFVRENATLRQWFIIDVLDIYEKKPEIIKEIYGERISVLLEGLKKLKQDMPSLHIWAEDIAENKMIHFTINHYYGPYFYITFGLPYVSGRSVIYSCSGHICRRRDIASLNDMRVDSVEDVKRFIKVLRKAIKAHIKNSQRTTTYRDVEVVYEEVLN